MTTTQLSLREKEQKIKQVVFKAQKQFEAVNKDMNFNKEASFAIQILSESDYLQKLDPVSIVSSVANVATIGLTLNPALKYAYLVPRGGKCVLDISYIGMIKLLTDAGAVKNIDAGVIYEHDSYDFRKGSEPYFKHKPTLSNKGAKVAAYAIAFFRDGGFQYEILGREEIEKIRNTSESWKNEKSKGFSPWEKWEDEMWKKTALKRLFKLLPKTHFSDNLIASIANEHENEITDIPKEEKYSEFFEEIQYAEEVKDAKENNKQSAKD